MTRQTPTGSYSLYFSETQKQQNEAEQEVKSFSDLHFPGCYPFLDQKNSKRYEATEFVPDRILFGHVFPGKPSFKDATLVASGIPAAALRRLPRLPVAERPLVSHTHPHEARPALAG